MSSRDSGTMAPNDPGEAIKVYVRVRQLLGREEMNKVEHIRVILVHARNDFNK